MNTEVQYRLIKKTFSYVPVGEKLYRCTETLEEVIKIPTIDLTNETTPIRKRRRFETRESSNTSPTGSSMETTDSS